MKTEQTNSFSKARVVMIEQNARMIYTKGFPVIGS